MTDKRPAAGVRDLRRLGLTSRLAIAQPSLVGLSRKCRLDYDISSEASLRSSLSSSSPGAELSLATRERRCHAASPFQASGCSVRCRLACCLTGAACRVTVAGRLRSSTTVAQWRHASDTSGRLPKPRAAGMHLKRRVSLHSPAGWRLVAVRAAMPGACRLRSWLCFCGSIAACLRSLLCCCGGMAACLRSWPMRSDCCRTSDSDRWSHA